MDAQRRTRPSSPSPDISTQLSALGILPNEIRSILLIYSGRNLAKSEVDRLEADIRKTPEDIDRRLKLIGYYDWNGRSSLDHLRLRTHVLWMVENHPEHPAVAEPSLRDLRDDPEGTAQMTELWYKNAATCDTSAAVLKSAEKFFFGKDPAEAERLIHCLAEKEPNNSQWANELAQLYRMSGIPGQSFASQTERALYAYQQVLELMRNPAARQGLAGDMAAAAFKIGDFEGAAALAKLDLQSSDRNATQRANAILGRVALRSGDIAASKQFLLDSIGSAAARDIATYGPTMALARELLEKGERDIVLDYLDRCLTLWPRGETTLRSWISEIKNGGTPNFGNLNE
jgi:tetratricopeptide (TPR) repeat protein